MHDKQDARKDSDDLRSGVKKERQPNHGLKAFLHRHNLTLTFAGAIIVFTTFVVKEGLRDQLKDLVDSIDAAKSVFLLRGDSNTTAEALRSVQQKLDSLEDSVNSLARVRNRDDRLADERMKMISYMLRSAYSSLDNTARLSHALPERSAWLNKGSQQLTKQADDMRLSADKLSVQMSHEVEGARSQRRSGDVYSPTSLTETAALEHFSEELMKQSNLYGDQVLMDAEKQREENEHRYKYFTWGSYGLYAVGWGLSLIGKLYGVEGLIVGG